MKRYAEERIEKGNTKEPEETDPLLRIMAEENDVFGSGKVLGNYNDNLSKDYSAVKDLEARALRAEALNKGV